MVRTCAKEVPCYQINWDYKISLSS